MQREHRPAPSRFRFAVADVHNGQYNPDAETQASEYTFPYGDEEFDVVVLTSVFTHMLPDDVAHYLDEIARVLKPGGRTLITWFLLNEETERLLDEQRTAATIPPRTRTMHSSHTTSAPIAPRTATCPGVRGRVLRALGPRRLRRSGLEIVEPMHYGAWAGRTETLHNQDWSWRGARANVSSPSTSAGISRAMRERGTTRSNPASSARRFVSTSTWE